MCICVSARSLTSFKCLCLLLCHCFVIIRSPSKIIFKTSTAPMTMSLVVTESTTPSNVVTIEPPPGPTPAPPVVDSAGGGGSSSNCRSDEFQCDDGSCVGRHFRCDNVPDCSDASDEDNCSRFSVFLSTIRLLLSPFFLILNQQLLVMSTTSFKWFK